MKRGKNKYKYYSKKEFTLFMQYNRDHFYQGTLRPSDRLKLCMAVLYGEKDTVCNVNEKDIFTYSELHYITNLK